MRASGVIHVHTVHSDGIGDVDDVVAAAKQARLDFVVITDHNDSGLTARDGYFDGVLVIVGTEISTRSGHMLALGLPDPAFRFTDDATEVFEDIDHFGGVALVAHPTSRNPDFRWRGWDLPGGWGIELLNGDSQWRAAGWPTLFRSLAAYPFNSVYALLRVLTPADDVRRQWDRLLATRNVPVVAGLDAHGGVRVGSRVTVGVPSYDALFRLARNHVLLDQPLTGNAARDAAAIVSSLRHGRGYFALDALAPGGGFSFVAEAGARRWAMGDSIPLALAPVLRAGGSMPQGSRLVLLRNGEVISETPEALTWPVAASGVYRIEVWIPGWTVPWIVSNPIYVFDPPDQDVRRQHGLLPPSVAARPPVHVIEDFEGTSSFEPVADEASRVDSNVIDVSGGVNRSRAARLAFDLALPTGEIPSPFAALVRLRQQDLSGWRGVTFSVRSDREYRVWVQVRDDNPRSADGTEWWHVSIRSDPEWRRIAVPFEKFRTRDPQSDHRLNREVVRGILFIIDPGVMRPGSRGVLWVDEIGVY
jgi:hypothetical protein